MKYQKFKKLHVKYIYIFSYSYIYLTNVFNNLSLRSDSFGLISI